MSRDRTKSRGIAVNGAWLPVPLPFLRSRACAELSPHGAKLFLDLLALLGPNATRNGNLSLTPRAMSARGWSSRATLQKAVAELIEHDLLAQTKQGSRLNCSLFAVTLFPLNCDLGKLDTGPGSYLTNDWTKHGERAPTEEHPAAWRRARKTVLVAPPRNEAPKKRSATEQKQVMNAQKIPTSFRHGTKTTLFRTSSVPPRVTYLDKPSVGSNSIRIKIGPEVQMAPHETLSQLWGAIKNCGMAA